jgi:alkylated DNA repair protein alkB family protein 5
MQASYTDPVLNRKGKGRHVLQYGSIYNYSTHQIEPHLNCLPMPLLFAKLIDQLIEKRSLPRHVRPDTAIVNIYRVGDNIPPHVDHTDYPRPFSTLSLLSEAPMLFGRHMTPLGDGQFSAPYKLVLPKQSLLVLDGHGANVTKHCIPKVSERRISITFRKMPEWAATATLKRQAREEQEFSKRA